MGRLYPVHYSSDRNRDHRRVGTDSNYRMAGMKNKPLISEEEFNKRHDKALRDADPLYKKRKPKPKSKPKPKKDMFKGLGGGSII